MGDIIALLENVTHVAGLIIACVTVILSLALVASRLMRRAPLLDDDNLLPFAPGLYRCRCVAGRMKQTATPGDTA